MNAHKYDTLTGGDGNGPMIPLPLIAILLAIGILSMGVI